MPHLLSHLLLVLGALGLLVAVPNLIGEWRSSARAAALRDHHQTVTGEITGHVVREESGFRRRFATYRFTVAGRSYQGSEPMTVRPEKGPVEVAYLPADPRVSALDTARYYREHRGETLDWWLCILLALGLAGGGLWLRLRPPTESSASIAGARRARRRSGRPALGEGESSDTLRPV